MGTSRPLFKLSTIYRDFAYLGTFLLTLSACGINKAPPHDINTPGVVQIESPLPIKDLPENAGDIQDIRDNVELEQTGNMHVIRNESPTDIGQAPLFPTSLMDYSYKTLRVRVFPLTSVPAQDPYPKTINPYNVSFYNSGKLNVYDLDAGQLLGGYNRVAIDSQNLKLYLDNDEIDLRRIYLNPIKTSVTTTVQYDSGAVKVEYRGGFRLEQTLHEAVNKTYWSVINYVELNDYLLSVVPSEMPAYFASEALKAQAVAARTYALFHAWVARNQNKTSWDVDPSTWFQSYRGALVESPAAISPAVIATSGVVMAQDGNLIEAFFSANSGGTLCSVNECFGFPDRPYIISKPDVDGVRLKPSGTWNTKSTAAGIHQRLQKLGSSGVIDLSTLLPGYKGAQDVVGLEAYNVGVAGRVLQLALNLANGTQVILDKETSKQMRWQFGMKTAYYLLDTAVNGDQAIEGYGLGHGVGMSQWGARILADQGLSYADILKFYYYNISLESL